MDKHTVYGMCMAMTLCACHTTKEATAENVSQETNDSVIILPGIRDISTSKPLSRSPQVFIYKLNNPEMYNHVPVIMSQDRTSITSYPAPTDLVTANGLRLPTRLDDDYLLDNKGITPNVAFLDYTYEEYSQLKEAPTTDKLMEHVVDKKPLSTWRYCGQRNEYTDIITQLNEIIKMERTQK